MLRIVAPVVVFVLVVAVVFVNATVVVVVSRQSFFCIQTRYLHLLAIRAYNLETNSVEYSLLDSYSPKNTRILL